MNFRVPFVLLFCTTFVHATDVHHFPNELLGTWIQPTKDETGVMLVYVKESKDNSITGILEIRGSKDCPQPVAFLGKIEEKKILIESTAKIVCGYGGKLNAVVLREGADAYVGNFVYTYTVLGVAFTWANGTFRLTGVEKKE
jgi:hypothetical protein